MGARSRFAAPAEFASKSRKGSAGDFPSLEELVRFLKSSASSEKGGGSVHYLVPISEIGAGFDVSRAFADALEIFAPLMRALTPTPSEISIQSALKEVESQSQIIPVYEPKDDEDGRRRVMREVAVRQGQAKFREGLLEAYDGRCAVTRCAAQAVLQAAHITPYRGTNTNSVQNGLLLRADLHNLFDLGLIQIDADSLEIVVDPCLRDTEYNLLAGKRIYEPRSSKSRPSREAIRAHRNSFS